MAALSFNQVYALARWAGFTPDQAVIMTAIATPESGRDPTSQNLHDNHDTQWSMGLWQISTGRKTVPDKHWDDPYVNAKLAFQKFKSQGFGAWGTYNTGAYRSYLPSAQSARSRVEGSRASGAAGVQAILATIPSKSGKGAVTGPLGLANRAKDAVKDAVLSPIESVVGNVERDVGKFVTTGVFVVLGLGLVGLGVYKSFQPQIRAAQNRAAELGGIALKAGV